MYTLQECEKIGRKKVIRPLVKTEDKSVFEFALWAHTRPYHVERVKRESGNVIVTLEVN